MKALQHTAVLLTLMAIVFFGNAQDLPTKLQEDLNSYYKSNLPLKLHLFTNQPAYSSGDTIFFKAILITTDRKFIGGKEVITVKIKDKDSKLIAEQKALINDGVGDGYVVIPETTAGIYTITAYSSWMKNQDPAFYFNKHVPVCGPFKFKLAGQPIAFFPEGGSLVSDVTNKVVVRAPDGSNGRVFSHGKEVASFTCNQAGLGSFYLKPSNTDFTYILNNEPEKPLPLAINDGVNLLTSFIDNGSSIRLVIQKSPQLRINQETHLMVWNQMQVLYTAELAFQGKESHAIRIPAENIPPGVNSITLFSADGAVLAERLFFVSREEKKSLNLEVDGEMFSVRQTVNATLGFNDPLLSGDLAISIYSTDLFGPDSLNNNVRTYLDLKSDVAELHLPSGLSPSDIDNFMITRQWRRFKWSDVVSRKVYNAYPFESNLSFKGKAFFKNSGKPVPDSTLLIFLLQNSLASYETETNAEGEFSFPLLSSFSGNENVYYQAYLKDRLLNGVRLELNDRSGNPEGPSFVATSDPDQYHKFVNEKKEVDDIFMSTRTLNIKPATTVDHEILNMIGGADVTIVLKDYVMFPTMKETIHEIIPYLKARTGSQGNFVRMYFGDLRVNPKLSSHVSELEREKPNLEAKEDPAYIIDGVLTDDTDYFLGLDPRDVISVKLIYNSKKLTQFGLAKKGLVVVETSRPENRKHIPPTKAIFVAPGFSEKRTYWLNQSADQRPRIPDLRAQLYWNPRVKIIAGKKVAFSFQTPDNPGAFKIVIDGISASGEPLHLERNFNVGFAK
jgi:hypothetical protein